MPAKKGKSVRIRQSHDVMVKSWMRDPIFKAEYDALEPEFALIKEMLQARKRAGLTQADVAKRMGTKAPAIARLESPISRSQHSPGIGTLRKYAHAVGCELVIHLKPHRKDFK